MPGEPWYADGLRFECTRCGHCCTGEPGTVRVYEEEIGTLASFLKLAEHERLRVLGERRGLPGLPASAPAVPDLAFLARQRRVAGPLGECGGDLPGDRWGTAACGR